MIILAGIFWGIIGVFSKTLSELGFTSIDNSAIRLVVAAIVFSLINRKHLKINLRDWWMFALLGIASVFFMTFVYFEAIKYTSISVASILLYTAPIMVTVMSCIFFHEKMSVLKITTLILTFTGIVMISGYDPSINLSAIGIFYGLMSGFSYSLYSIIGKFVLKKYSSESTTTYAFIFAALAAVIICDFSSFANTFSAVENKAFLILMLLGTGVFTAVIPYTLYTIGLKHIPAGKASVLASVEPLTATLVGVMFYSEKLGFVSILGIVLILGSVIMLSVSKR